MFFITEEQQRRSLWLAKNEPERGDSRELTNGHVIHRAFPAMIQGMKFELYPK